MKFLSHSLENTEKIARDFIALLEYTKKSSAFANSALVVGLSGDLGSGKTTFTQAIARTIGIKDTVTSPTFVLEKIYKLSNPVSNSLSNTVLNNFSHFIHIDAYRLEKSSELLNLGWNNIITDPHNFIFIEWPERVNDILPKNIIHINFIFIDEISREITIMLD